MIGKKISHYIILEKLGAGGMGVVYKAQDTKLDRTVALKFLPPHLSFHKEEKKRFIHEARASAALDHQNICAVHEIGETAEGQMFITMAYYKGETIKEKVDKGPLSIAEAVNITIQVAQGLQIAHESNIIHRDIKSANIIVTKRNEVKILDFGVAKMRGVTKLTKEGTTLGTVAYMSPEQTSGDKVDSRSDIWSLGVLLNEMVTGQLPFKGDYEQAVMYAIMNEEPEPVTGLRTGVSLELERIINKTLAKDPQERYQTAADLLVDLKNITKGSKSEAESAKKELKSKVSKKPSRKILLPVSLILAAILLVCAFLLFKGTDSKESLKTEVTNRVIKIAVLPFVNMSMDKDQEYFCDGISEELINRLAKISAFRVTARTSAFSFKGKNLDVPSMGKKLKVDIILDGSVRKEGNKLRITAQLIKVADGFHLWSETYNRLMKDVFAIQDEISQSIVEKLKVSLLKKESTELKMRPTGSVEAYNLYLRGISYLNRSYAEKDFRFAVQIFEQAIALDPGFALAYVQLSMTLLNIYWYPPYDDSRNLILAKAKSAVDKALKLSPGLPEAYLILGYYYYWGHMDYDRALEQFKIARKSLKDNTEILNGMAAIQRRRGKWEQSVVNLRKSLEINPLSHDTAINLGHNYLYLRRYQEAEKYYNLTISLAPDLFYSYFSKIRLYLLWQGSTEKALQVLAEAPEAIHSSNFVSVVSELVRLYVFDGDYKKALKQLTFFSADIHKELWRAWIYGLLKKPERARKHYGSARVILENEVRKNPESARAHSLLGIAYAGLGRKAEAIRQGKLGIKFNPLIRDAFDGLSYLLNLSKIYLMVGEYDLAIDQLEFLLSIPSQISIPLIRIDPDWDRLRDNPRFRKLLKGKE